MREMGQTGVCPELHAPLTCCSTPRRRPACINRLHRVRDSARGHSGRGGITTAAQRRGPRVGADPAMAATWRRNSRRRPTRTEAA